MNHTAVAKHLKTGNNYFVIGRCINATNANDGQLMILYANTEGMLFVREEHEFNEKFDIISMADSTEHSGPASDSVFKS